MRVDKCLYVLERGCEKISYVVDAIWIYSVIW